MKLAIFPGGFRREAAEKVAGAPLSLLFTLVDKSLLRASATGRYDMHTLLHQFITEKLAQSDQEAPIQLRLMHYYLDYARQHQHDYATLEEERLNLMTCMEAARRNWLAQLVLDYAEVLGEMWSARGHWSDARKAYAWACDAARAHDDEKALAANLRNWGRACIEQGDYEEATGYLRQSLQLHSQMPDRREIANIQYDLARVAIDTAEHARAADLLDKAHTVYEQLNDDSGIANTLFMQAWLCYDHSNYDQANELARRALQIQEAHHNQRKCIETLRLLANIAMHGFTNYAIAEEYCYRAVSLCNTVGDNGELAVTLQVLAEALRLQGKLDDARLETEKSLLHARQMGLRKIQAIDLFRLSKVDADRGDLPRALLEGQQSLALCRALPDRWGMVYVLDHLASILAQRNDELQCRAMWREAFALAQELDHPLIEHLRERLAM
jgi:tetratricopeptide (TPR) repeat protein